MEIEKTPKVTFFLSYQELTELKIMCVVTHTTMSFFIRSAIKEKLKKIKEEKLVKEIKHAQSNS